MKMKTLGSAVLSLSIHSVMISALFVISDHAFAKTLTDHRVKSLSCQNVTADSVARAMKPEVFSSSNHLPYENWSFQWGLYELGDCWSLSRFQRLYFYL